MTESAEARCRRYRRRILEVSRQVTAAHVSPAFSCLEMVDALYHDVMRPDDIFIMSKGHGYLAQLVILEDLGLVARDEMDAYCKPVEQTLRFRPRSFGAHPDYEPEIGIHASTGSLGHGLGVAMGQAYAEKLRGSGVRVYCLLSDGECQEGSTWEAAMVAANLRLTNLVALVDHNNWGGMDCMSTHFPVLAPLVQKFAAFGWHNWEVDGHAGRELVDELASRDLVVAPTAVVCHTVKGRGVSYMESGQPLWHYRSPNDAEYAQAMRELADPEPVRAHPSLLLKDDYCEICCGPCLRLPRHGEFGVL